MKLILKQGKRILSVAIACIMLISVVVPNLYTSVLAAGTSYNLYTFIATNCYSNQPVAMRILTSGALIDAGSVVVSYPENNLLSVSDGKLNAESYPSGFPNANWEPATYTIDGAENSFYGANSVSLTQQGEFDVDVTYQLNTGISGDNLKLPATLAAEAASQITVLNHLISYDKPYMDYMEQMSDSQMESLYDVLDPSSPYAGHIVLSIDPADTQKNVALKCSFREVIAEMRANCYLDDGTLTLFDLLIWYEMEGLIHYYLNSEAYLTEIGLLNQYLNRMLAEETRDGVYMSEADKEYAIEVLVALAQRFGYIEGDVTLDFVDLRDNISIANAMLTAPNEKINLNNESKLQNLVDVLETEAVVEGDVRGEEEVVWWNSTVTAYSQESLILRHTVSQQLINEISDDDDSGDNNNPSGDTNPGNDNNQGDDNSGGDSNSAGDNGSGDDSSSGSDGNTGGDSGSSSDGNTGGDSNSGSGSNTDGDSGSGSDSNLGGDDNLGDNNDGSNTEDNYNEANTSYVGTTSNLEAALTNAGEGETVHITSAITLDGDISVNNAINITGAEKLDDTGYVLTLTDPNASIAADGSLNVASGVDGYVPVKAENSHTYTLAEVQHPKTGGETAGSKTEKLSSNRYLFLDLDPVNGMTLDALYSSTSFGDMAEYTVTFSIEGNTGSGLVKTADHLVVKAFNADGKCVAQISYVVIVMGDTNCNGKVNTSDATVVRNIGLGKESSFEACLASDVNFSRLKENQDPEVPKVNSSDISYMMSKWFSWDQDKYVSNLE